MPISSFFSSLPSIPIPSFVSLIPLYESYLKLCYTYYLRLSSRVVDVSPSASLHFWSAECPGTTLMARPVLVLLHGFGPTASALHQFPVDLLRDLSEHFRLVIPDLLFFHPSSATTSPDRSELSQASAVIGLLDVIGVEQFHVLGTSYGGFVACRVAILCGPERVGKVVVASSGVNLRRRNNEELMRKAGVEHVEEVLLPETPAGLRRLLELAVWNPRVARMLPDFALSDVINVSMESD